MSNNIFTGKEIYEMYKDKYPSINEKYNTENIFFELKRIPKEEIYKFNLIPFDAYSSCDQEQIKNISLRILSNDKMLPMIIDKDNCIVNGAFRLTAYSIIPETTHIEVFKEIISKGC